jgi:hypothetical protein
VLDGSFPSIDRDHLRWARAWAENARKCTGREFLRDLFQRDTYTTYCDLELRAVGASSRDWLYERQTLRSLDLELSESRNPGARNSTISLEHRASYDRYLRAQLRMLRVAMTHLAGGVPLDLDDPFGGKLKTSLGGDMLRVWSIGPDAVDDGGVGDWGFKGKDVVLELKRRSGD